MTRDLPDNRQKVILPAPVPSRGFDAYNMPNIVHLTTPGMKRTAVDLWPSSPDKQNDVKRVRFSLNDLKRSM